MRRGFANALTRMRVWGFNLSSKGKGVGEFKELALFMHFGRRMWVVCFKHDELVGAR